MISPRRRAQLGVLAASVVFLTSVSIIVAGALPHPAHSPTVAHTVAVTPSAASFMGSVSK